MAENPVLSVVFLSSELYSVVPDSEDAVPVYERFPKPDGGFYQSFYSTRRLEAAIQQKCRIWVLEASSPDEPFNAWWKALLAKAKDIESKVVRFEEYLDMRSDIALATIDQIYRALGLPWDDSFETWNRALHSLTGMKDKGVLRGYEITPLSKHASPPQPEPEPHPASEAKTIPQRKVLQPKR